MAEGRRDRAGRARRTTHRGARGQDEQRGRPALGRAALAAAWLALVAGVALGAACDRGQRFPVCESNADCAERSDAGVGPVCFNLKCVACRYDTDCELGHACTSANRCEAIDKRDPETADAGAVRWDPSTWAECAERCKEPACLKKCSERFEP